MGNGHVLLLLGSLLSAQSIQSGSSRWQREQSDGNVCSLSQQQDDGRTLTVTRTPGSDATTLALGSPGGSKPKWIPFEKASVVLDDGGEFAAEGYLIDGMDGQLSSLTMIVKDQSFIPRLGAASTIKLYHKKVGTSRATIHDPAHAVNALVECEDKKMHGWGIDAQAWRTLRARPQPLRPLSNWFTPNDYPRFALANDIQGDVLARLDVGANGRVQHCSGIRNGMAEVFHHAVCAAAVRKARFSPALDASGKPTTAPFVALVRFRLPQ